jgi:hypothetical protein
MLPWRRRPFSEYRPLRCPSLAAPRLADRGHR